MPVGYETLFIRLETAHFNFQNVVTWRHFWETEISVLVGNRFLYVVCVPANQGDFHSRNCRPVAVFDNASYSHARLAAHLPEDRRRQDQRNQQRVYG